MPLDLVAAGKVERLRIAVFVVRFQTSAQGDSPGGDLGNDKRRRQGPGLAHFTPPHRPRRRPFPGISPARRAEKGSLF
jgi:hypothetical protein